MASKTYEAFRRILTDCREVLEDERTGFPNELAEYLEKNTPEFFSQLNTNLHIVEKELETLQKASEKPNATEEKIRYEEKLFGNMMGVVLKGIYGIANEHLKNPDISKETKASLNSYMTFLQDKFMDGLDALPEESAEKLRNQLEEQRKTVYEDVTPTKEQVLRWYASMQQTLQEQGIDLSKPEDRMRIQTVEYKDNALVPGDYVSNDGYLRYALMRRAEDPKTGLLGYEHPEPEVSAEDQRKLTKLNTNQQRTYNQLISCTQALQDTIKAKKDTTEATRALEEARDKFTAAQKELVSHREQIWAQKDKWLISNTEKFDIGKPEDFEQIRMLFNAARDGRLFIAEMEGNPIDRRHIVVTRDGRAGLAPVPVNDAISPSTILNDALPKNIDEIYPGLRDEVDIEPETYHLQEVPKRPAEVEPAPKPGVWSRFKYIISFGLAHGDYDRYDAYQKNKEELRQYDETIDQVKAEVKAHNEKAVRHCEALVSEYREKEFPEGTLNPGRVIDSQQLADSSYARAGLYEEEENLQENILDPEYHAQLLLHKKDLWRDVKEHPASFAPDGSRTEEGRAYDMEKAMKHPLIKEAIQKSDSALVKGGMLRSHQQDREKALAGQADRKAYADARKDQQFSFMKPWADEGLDTVLEKIGALWGKEGEEARRQGLQVFAGVVTQNQPTLPNGEMKLPQLGEAKSSKECLEELEQLLQIADDPPVPGNTPKYNEFLKFREHLDVITDKKTNLHRLTDSLCAVITENGGNDLMDDMGKMDLSYLTRANGQCAALLDRCLKNPASNLDTFGPDDVSDAFERNNAMLIAKEAAPIQRGGELHHQAMQERAAKMDALSKTEAKDLNLKQHGMNIQL